MPVRDIILDYYPQFTKSEKIVADFYLSNPTEAYVLRLCDLSEILRVGEATILRFVKKCGYSSYTNFQYDFSNELSNHLSKSRDSQASSDEFLENNIIELRYLAKSINLKQVSQAADMIDQASFIGCIGITYSEMAARFFCLDLKMAGKNAGLFASTNEITNICRISPKDSVLIIFSRLGETNEIINALNIANREQIKVIGITKPESHLGKMSDLVIDCTHSKNPYDMSFSTFATTLNQVVIAREILNAYQNIDYNIRHKQLLNSHKLLMQASGTLKTPPKNK